MALADYQLQIGSLVLGPGTDYIVHAVQGLGTTDVRASDVARPLDHGLFYGRDFLGGRSVSIDLTVRGTSDAVLVANLDALQAAWKPISVDASTVSPLAIKLPGKPTMQLNGRPRRSSINATHLYANNAPVSLEYVSADPRLYAQDVSSLSLVLAQSTTGRSYNRAYNYGYGGGGTSAVQTATNLGNFATRPTVTIFGPASNPTIENSTTNQSLMFAITLASGEFLVVDFDARTVLLNGTASRYNTLKAGSVFFELAPGDSAVRFTSDVYDPAASATFTWRSAWL